MLQPESIAALKALVVFVDHNAKTPHNCSYLRTLRLLEHDLTEEARRWWFDKSSDELRSMLAKWVPSYRNVETRNGFTVHRFIKTRQVYASRPCATGQQEPWLQWTHI